MYSARDAYGTLKQVPSKKKPPFLALTVGLTAGLLFASWLGSNFVLIYLTALTVYALTDDIAFSRGYKAGIAQENARLTSIYESYES